MVKKSLIITLVSFLLLGLFFIKQGYAADKSPQLEFKIDKEADEINYQNFSVKGNSQTEANVTISAIDEEKTMLVKTTKTNDKGDFDSNLNLASLVDGKVTVKIIAENAKGSSIESQQLEKMIQEDTKTYTLTDEEEARWNINDKGKNAKETTTGLNEAIKWAGEHGYTEVKIEDGTYLIAKTDKSLKTDLNNTVHMISNMTLSLSDNAVFQKETNNEQIYSIFYFGNIDNASIKGGKIIGDRETHDYSKPIDDGLTTNTHEWGNAIYTKGASNVTIDGVYIKGTTGDALEIGASTQGGSYLTKFEKGAIDDNGNPIAKNGKIRTVGRTETNFDNRKIYDEFDNFYMWLPQGINSKDFDVYFYEKDGKFIEAQKSLRFYNKGAKIPKNADYFIAVFDGDSTTNVKINRMTVDISENITFKNSEIDNTRRQGISVVGSKDVKILNNKIHDVRGVAPQSGIDIEPGYFPALNTVIKGNVFDNNRIQIVLAYGQGADISDNFFEKGENGSVGLYTYEAFTDLTANNNTFKGLGIHNNTINSKMDGNSFFDGATATLTGNGQEFTNATFKNATLNVGNGENQNISNIDIQIDGYMSNPFDIGTKKVDISNVKVSKVKNSGVTNSAFVISGMGNDKSSYKNITLKDETQKGAVLPAGEFTDIDFDIGSINFNRVGKYSIENGSIKADTGLIGTSNLYGQPDITFNKIKFEQRGNTGYGGSIYLQGAKSFKMYNSEVLAGNSTSTTALIRIGNYGKNVPTEVFGVDFFNVIVKTKKGVKVNAIDTTNAGVNAPSYRFENLTVHNGLVSLKANDVNINFKTIND